MSQTELYVTAVELVPYGEVLVKGFKLVEAMYDFGKTDKVADAIARLKSEIERIKQDLDRVNERVNEIHVRLAANENLARIRELRRHSIELLNFANRLTQATAQEVAFGAKLEAQAFLDDRDLWLWSDLKKTITRDENGEERFEEIWVDADFKTYPALPTFASALLLYMAAIQLECGGDRTRVQRGYGDQLRRFIATVSVRPNWIENQEVPGSFPEEIKARITCYPVAQHKYAQDRACRFSIVCNEAIARRTTSPGELTLEMPAGQDVLCTASPDVAWSFEQELEAADLGLQTFSTLESMLRQLETTGSLGFQFIGQFGAFSQLQQGFTIAAHVAAGDGFLGAFPTFRETTRGLDVYSTIVFLRRSAGEQRDIPLADLGNLDLANLNDAKFGDWMRAINTYASANGFVGGFPIGWYGDYGHGTVCPAILLRHEAAEWRDVYVTHLGNVSLDDVKGRFKATHDYARNDGFVGGFPNLFHAAVGGGGMAPVPAGIVCGTLLIRPEFGEARETYLYRMPA
jgi:hypothetical protein